MMYKIKFEDISKWIILILFSIVTGIGMFFSDRIIVLFFEINNWLNVFNSFAVLLLAVIGWLVALFLQNKNIRDNSKAQIKYDIYKNLVVESKNIQDSLIKISVKGQFSPLDMMRATFIFTKNSNDGLEVWKKYIVELEQMFFTFLDQHYSFLCIFDYWNIPLDKIKNLKIKMGNELKIKEESINSKYFVLKMYSYNKGIDWQKWDNVEIKNMLDEIQKNADEMLEFISDFIYECQKELIGESFDYEKTYLEKNNNKKQDL